MTNSPRILTIEDDARIMMADVNADGLSDLVQVRFDAVDVWLNLGGTAWSDRVILDGVPYHPGIVNRIRVADVNGSTSTDVMWGTADRYQFLDFTGGIQPRLLVSVENGMGKTSAISYRSSTAYAAEARVERDVSGQVHPWTSFSPFPTQVVASSSVTDGLTGTYVTEYKYHNAYYDGWEAEFRGFGEAKVKTVGDGNSPTSVSITRFEPGLKPDWACDDLPLRLLDPDCRFVENPLEALKGAVTSTETCDETAWTDVNAAICQGAATSRYAVRKLYEPASSDRSVWYAYARTSYSLVYDTSVAQGTHAADPVADGGYNVYTGANETSEELGDGDWPLLAPSLPAGRKYTLKSETPDVDFWGNVEETINHGALDLAGDEVTTRAEYDAGLIGSRYIHRVSRSYTLDDDGATALADTLTEYATPGPCNHLPSAVRVAGSNPDTWDSATDPPTDPEGTFELVRSNVIYDEARFCQPIQTCSGGLCGVAPLGQAWVKYDDQYAAFPTHETIDVSSPGNTAYDAPAADRPVTSFSGDGRAFLVTRATWYAEYGAIATATDPSGLTTSVVLDNLGRPVRMYRPGCGEPAAEIAYHLGSPVSYVHTRTNETCQSDSTAAITGDAMEAYAYVDGMGRARGAISEGSATDLLPGILSGVQAFDAKGALQRAYLPCTTAFPPPVYVTAVPGCSGAAPLYARSAYDAFGRVTRAWTTDGTEVVATRYGALVTDVWDAGDLGSGLYHGTPATTYVDGLGRTVRTVERNRSEDDPAVETFATELVYNPLGAVIEMTRGRVSGDQRTSSFSGGEFVVKTQIYDTLGRRVTNDDPDAGIYRYAYDAVDRLIATHDARTVTNRYWYDRGGRLVAEDLGGQVAYQPGSWDDAGGADGRTCTTHPDPDGNCFDVVYGFDQPYVRSATDAWDDLMPAEQGPLAGRPSWTRDRAGTVVLGYDPHGWAVWSGRQIAPDVTTGYFSQSTFDEGQRLLAELNPDISEFRYQYTSRGLLWSVDFYEAGATAPQPLVRETYYDVQGRKVEVEYGDRYCTDPSSCPEPDIAEGTRETYTYDSRQRLARKRAVRADDLVLLDYRYTYDSASNIVRIDDGRIPCWVAGATSVDPVATCPSPGPDVSRFVTYDITYSYDALYRLTKATPLYKLPEEDRVGEQRWSFDALGSMETWTDPADHFYGWSLGSIVNGLDVGTDPGLGPLPEDPAQGCQVDILDRCVAPRLAPAPHALYAATSTGGDDELAAFYDAAGNMAALVVHRPRGCAQENETGGPDGLGCKEGETFALFFAWDEVGNLLAADRRSAVVTDLPTAPPEPGCTLDPDPLPFFGVVTGQYVWWCPAASLQSAYDFGNQRRLKVETYHDGNPQELPDGYSLYVSANYERRNVAFNDATNTYGGEDAIDARYARDGLATTWELDSAGPDGSVLGKYRLTLTNHLSSIGVVLDASVGAPLRHFSQLPYGAEEKVVAPVGWEAKDVGRYEFTGKERDRGVGLVYFGARFLDSRLGRWPSPDPALRLSGERDDNPYRHASATAIYFVDPDGRDVVAGLSFVNWASWYARYWAYRPALGDPAADLARREPLLRGVSGPVAQEEVDALLDRAQELVAGSSDPDLAAGSEAIADARQPGTPTIYLNTATAMVRDAGYLGHSRTGSPDSPVGSFAVDAASGYREYAMNTLARAGYLSNYKRLDEATYESFDSALRELVDETARDIQAGAVAAEVFHCVLGAEGSATPAAPPHAELGPHDPGHPGRYGGLYLPDAPATPENTFERAIDRAIFERIDNRAQALGVGQDIEQPKPGWAGPDPRSDVLVPSPKPSNPAND
jgi:RHS repeat-associated protein